MTIKKYQGKTKEAAIEAAKAELGEQVVIMNIKEVKPNGFSGLFKKSTYEVANSFIHNTRFTTDFVNKKGGYI